MIKHRSLGDFYRPATVLDPWKQVKLLPRTELPGDPCAKLLVSYRWLQKVKTNYLTFLRFCFTDGWASKPSLLGRYPYYISEKHDCWLRYCWYFTRKSVLIEIQWLSTIGGEEKKRKCSLQLYVLGINWNYLHRQIGSSNYTVLSLPSIKYHNQ